MPKPINQLFGGGGFAGAVSLGGGGVSAGVSGEVVVLGGVVLGSPELPPGVVAVSPAPGAGVVVSAGGGVSVLGSRGPQAANNTVAAQSGIINLVLMGTPESGGRAHRTRARTLRNWRIGFS